MGISREGSVDGDSVDVYGVAEMSSNLELPEREGRGINGSVILAEFIFDIVDRCVILASRTSEAKI